MHNQTATTLPKSEFFTLQLLREGVYVALSKEGKGSWANAGILDLGDQTLIFDTCATPKAAADLRKAAEELTGRPARYVINSHDHIDHVHGNQVFADATIISTALTRERIALRQPKFIEMVRNDNGAQLVKMAQQLEAEQDPNKRHELEVLLGEFTAIDEAVQTTKMTLPTLTFEDHLVINGSARRAELITYGGGHSVSDAFLYLREEKIVFLGDLMHIGYHADFRQGNHREWLYILDQVQKLDIETVVAGHGAVGTREDLNTMRQYLLDLDQFASDWVESGGTLETIADAVIPAKYASLGVPSVFYGNLRSLLQKQRHPTE
jgi:cyclase